MEMLGGCSLHQYTITWLVSKSKIMRLCPLLYHPIICNVIYTRSMQEFEFGFTFLQKHCLLSSGSFRPYHTYTGRRLLKFIKLYNLIKLKWLLRAQLTHMPTTIGYACARREKYRFICLSASIDVYKTNRPPESNLDGGVHGVKEELLRVIGLLCGQFIGHRWITRTEASDAELWYFLWFASEQTVE